ncbi:MAG: family lipase [Herbinix sp.]|jgi:lysophospholipase L1-like esterase|nr:family lipase [Herbinix sp.]
MRENNNYKIHALSELEHVKVHGRTTGCLSPLTLFWTGSGIELNVKGSEIWIEVEVDYDTYEPWISILINEVPVSRQMLTSGRYWICVFRGMNGNVVKNVRIVKDVQAMNGDPGCCLQIHSIKLDGELLPVEDKPYKIEFIGDSITSGEGSIGAKEEEDWISMWFSAVYHYGTLTAQAMNADYRILSQSGWGVLTSWDNNPYANLPDYYEKVCGILTGEKNKELGALEENDFDSWQPDVIVVNLGTNDGGAFFNSAWKDEITGETHKQRLNEDGSFCEEDVKLFEEAVEKFLVKLRKYNKKAKIVWAYGMLGISMMPAIYRAVASYITHTGDKSVSVFQLPNTNGETVGARNHPGQLSHERAAKDLSDYLKQMIGI